MKVSIEKLLQDCGLEEQVYPGKRIVQKLPQPGEHKSHCAVYDWRDPDTFRLEIRAGLSGRNLDPRDLKKFPVSFQTPTFIEIGVNANENEESEDEEEGEQGDSGKGGGGGRKMKPQNAFHAFSQVVEGKVPSAGEIKKMVVMGKEIAQAAWETVLTSLTAQIKSLAIIPVNILAAANALKVKVAMPGGGLAPKGDETVKYKYKGAEMFGITPS